MQGVNSNKPSGEKNSEPQRKFTGDPSSDPGANEYGFQDIFSTRSGHNLTYSDVDGKEYIRMQHRSGSGWIYNPDGSAKMTIFNGFYNDIRGEMVINTSGDFDLRSERHGSIRTEGSFDVTSTQTSMTSHDGTHIATGGNMRMMVAGSTHMVTNGLNIHGSGESPIYIGSDGGTTLAGANITMAAQRKGGGLAAIGGSQVGIRAEDSIVSVGAAQGISISTVGGEIRIDANGNKIYINSGPGTKPEQLEAIKTAFNESPPSKNPMLETRGIL